MRKDNRRKSNQRDRGNYGGGGGGFKSNFNKEKSFSTTKMHKVTCAECGQECEVPFKPTEGRPVYCRDCFEKKKPRF